jgi:hypothetical protein
MKELFDKTHASEILERLKKLEPDSKPLWGKMNVSQMLSHIQGPIEVGLGDKKLKRTFIGLLFGKIAKRKLYGDGPFTRNLPTDASFVRKGDHDFEMEKQKVVELLNRFVAAGPEGLTKNPHPFFGKLTPTEWSSSSWKHLDHHLSQFGV